MQRARKPPGIEDLDALPRTVKGEIIEGVLYTMSRPRGRHDLLIKKPYYAKVGVPHHWLIDRAARTLTAYRLESGRWLELGVYGDEREARIEPFHAVPFDVASLWA
jgi:hypothetical protein